MSARIRSIRIHPRNRAALQEWSECANACTSRIAGRTQHTPSKKTNTQKGATAQGNATQDEATRRKGTLSRISLAAKKMSEESPASGSGSGQRYRPSPAFSFPPAFQPSIIRSFQKDGYYLSLLRTQFADVVRSVFGSRFLQVHSEQLTVLVGVAYYVFSTYQGSQTLGEEYVGSRMVGRKQRFVSGRRRMVFVLSHVLLPYLLSRVYAAVRRRLSASNAQRKQTLQRAQMRQRAVGGGSLQSGNEPRPSRVDRVVEALVKYLPTIEDLQRPDGWLTYATALHLMAFYLGGRYYKLAQRFARVRYVSRRESGDESKGGK